MFSAFIVEDEYFIIRELVGLINWNELGFNIVGQAANGKEAYDFLSKNKVDLIITDIEMPFMDGISLIKKLRESGETAEVIFLTAFSEFYYAQQGVKLAVADYLLKPIEKELLIESLIKIKSKLNVDDEVEIDIDNNSGYKKNLINKAQNYIRKNIEQNVPLSEVADHLCISKNYFCTLYKQETGENFSDFVAKEKIKIAKKMLLEGSLKVYEICEKLGYQDVTNFSKLFRKTVGVTPVDYRRNGEKFSVT